MSIFFLKFSISALLLPTETRCNLDIQGRCYDFRALYCRRLKQKSIPGASLCCKEEMLPRLYLPNYSLCVQILPSSERFLFLPHILHLPPNPLPPVLLLPRLSFPSPSPPGGESFGGFSALPGWSPAHLNDCGVPLQTLSSAVSLPLLSHSPSPPLILSLSFLKWCHRVVFFLLCCDDVLSALIFFKSSLWLNILVDNKVMLTESLLALVTLKIRS